MKFNKTKACEVVSANTGIDVNELLDGAHVTATAFEMFQYIYLDEIDTHDDAVSYMTQMAHITPDDMKHYTSVADVMVSTHDNVYKTDYGYVYFVL